MSFGRSDGSWGMWRREMQWWEERIWEDVMSKFRESQKEIWVKMVFGRTPRTHRCFTCTGKKWKEKNCYQKKKKEILVPDVSSALKNLPLVGNEMNSSCNWKWHFSDSPVLTIQPQMNATTSQISISFGSNSYFRPKKKKKSYTSDGWRETMCNKLH